MRSPLDEIVLELEHGASPSEVALLTGALFDRLHGGASDYEIIVPEALLEQNRQTQRLFDIVMAASPASRCWSAALAS